jgi:uncharacterized protein
MGAVTLPTLFIAGTFVLAGSVKGATGMGLPTVAIGLLGLLMKPAEAAAFIIVPSLVTNVWQFMTGPHRLTLLRRMWSMLLAIAVATWVGAGLIAYLRPERATMYLGLTLSGYALLGLLRVRLAVDTRRESWLSPLMGAATGIITGATGVSVIPAAPYLQALGLDRDDLVQALGLSFTVSNVALALGLASYGALHASALGASLLCTVPALVGVFVGQAVRARMKPATFRFFFFFGLLLLGGDLMARAVI